MSSVQTYVSSKLGLVHSRLDASLTYIYTTLSSMAVSILLNYNYVRATTYMTIRTVIASTYNSLRTVRTYLTPRKYISLSTACTQASLLNVNYVHGLPLPPLAYVQCTRGYSEKRRSLQGRGKVHTQFLFFISLMVLLSGGCTHIAPAPVEESVPPKVFELFIPQEKTFTHCNPPSCEEVDLEERMKGHACDSKPTSCI